MSAFQLVRSTPVGVPPELANFPPADWVSATPEQWRMAERARLLFIAADASMNRAVYPDTVDRRAMQVAVAGVQIAAARACIEAAQAGIDLTPPDERAPASVPAERLAPVAAVAVPPVCPMCSHPVPDHLRYPPGTGPHPEVVLEYAACSGCRVSGGACR